MRLILHPHQLRLKHTFRIAHDSRNEQQTLIVEITDGEISGFGEATANKYYQNTIDGMMDLLERNRDFIEGYLFENPQVFWERLQEVLRGNPFALAAVDEAIHDLFAKKKGLKVAELWDLEKKSSLPQSNYTIGIDTIENMAMKMKTFPWPIYKIKLGTPDDIKIVEALREISDAVFRVDANCGWGVEETITNAHQLKSLGVEFIEQPLPADNWDGMRKVKKESVLPIIADESCIVEEDVIKCVGYFHGVNIKLMKCGGFTPAVRMIQTANEHGLQTMVGCMTESSVGTAAVAQLRPFIDYIDMDGFLLIDDDTANGPYVENQEIFMPDRPGIGIDSLVN